MVRDPRRRWLRAFAVGVGGTGFVTVACLAIDLPATIPALLLLVPITVAGVLGGALVAVPVAVIAAFAYAMAFLPPYGHVRIGLTEDVFVLITFVGVALLVAMVTHPRSVERDLLDDRRAVLLRGVSHDLRNPLSTIRSVSTDLLDGPDYDPTTRAQLLNVVVDESERLDRIVGNLLSVTRIQAGALIPDREACPVDELIDNCVTRLNRSTGQSARARSQVTPRLPPVLADHVQIDQVLTNLVENARRAAPADSEIWVTAQGAGSDAVEFCVTDSGPGFGAIDRDALFDPFRSSSGSTGLGLAVCKAIVEAHDGTISVGTSASGGGAVTFTLPVAG